MQNDKIGYKIKVRKGDLEIEVQGDKEFVENKFKELKDATFVSNSQKEFIVERKKTEKSEILGADVEKLATEVGTTKEQLRDIFEFDEQLPQILVASNGKKKEKQQNAALAVLTANSYCYMNDEIPSRYLTKQINTLKIGAEKHLSGNLSLLHPKFIVKKGSGKKAIYRITSKGKDRGVNVIREMLGMEEGGS